LSIVSFLLTSIKQLLLYNQRFGRLEYVKNCPWCTFFLFFCQRIKCKTSFKSNATSAIGWEIETVVKYFTFVMTTLYRASIYSSQTTAVKIKQKRKKRERRKRKKYRCFWVVVIFTTLVMLFLSRSLLCRLYQVKESCIMCVREYKEKNQYDSNRTKSKHHICYLNHIKMSYNRWVNDKISLYKCR